MKHKRSEWAEDLRLWALNLEPVATKAGTIDPDVLTSLEHIRKDLAPHDEAARAAEADVTAVERVLAKVEASVVEAYKRGVPFPEGWTPVETLIPKQERWTQEAVENLIRHLGFEPATVISECRAMGLIGGVNKKITWEYIK